MPSVLEWLPAIAAAVMIALDGAWLAATWRLAGRSLRTTASLAALIAVIWVLTVTAVLPAGLTSLRSPAIDLTGVLWHAGIVPAALLARLAIAWRDRRRDRRQSSPGSNAASRSTSHAGASSGTS